MTLMQAAQKWGISLNWVRELVKSGRVKATLRKDVPVPFYDIPDNTPKPPSMQRAPYRKGSSAKVQPASIERRAERAKARMLRAKKPAKSAVRAKKRK